MKMERDMGIEPNTVFLVRSCYTELTRYNKAQSPHAYNAHATKSVSILLTF